MPIWYAPVAIPKRANTYLAGSRTSPSTSPTGDTRCRAQSVHQSHRMQSQGPPSCPTSQLTYWQPKGLPAPPITLRLDLLVQYRQFYSTQKGPALQVAKTLDVLLSHSSTSFISHHSLD